MERHYFSRDLALAKLRRRIRTRIRFTGVPLGTDGIVIAADEIACERFSLAVRWVFPDGSQNRLEWLSRTDYERFLVELPEASVYR